MKEVPHRLAKFLGSVATRATTLTGRDCCSCPRPPLRGFERLAWRSAVESSRGPWGEVGPMVLAAAPSPAPALYGRRESSTGGGDGGGKGS
eukprot:CAMPEP_0206433602 /NCGR_PEP_ID=MMETSP0324_2-20121206/8628_1 /ASSEMBLY_ACC=CAM_ASM_000836 /TAXON_ID=2866 /ORGANISM="Crypthecodinium cohnii, Strain Seligo" /LENGTH=90 /DNA_ID=CAMNT_0053899893 /DNA_START=377 /DNA_END=649 /DNA_ORIENTATION=+